MSNLRLEGRTESEKGYRVGLIEALRQQQSPDEELLDNLYMFLTKKELGQLIFFYEIYKQGLEINGNIVEFGSRWGRNLALFTLLRGLFEPYNFTRRIVGFDTFSGFPNISEKDGTHDSVQVGAYSIASGYKEKLEHILDLHESDFPINHIKKYELVQGDISITAPEFFAKHPEFIVSLAYFDVDLYEPTKVALEETMKRVVKGSILIFDELNCPHYPGETVALFEILKNYDLRVRRSPTSSWKSYVVVGS